MHANALADLIGAYPLVIPPGPGVMSAFGFLTSDVQNEFTETYLEVETDVSGDDVAAEYATLREEAAEWLASEGIPSADHAFDYYADCRYYRQDIQMSIPVALDALTGAAGLTEIKDDFETRHDRQFGFSLDAPLEIANLRVIGRGTVAGVELAEEDLGGADPSAARVDTETVYFGETFHDTPVYARERLQPGNRLAGPAVVVEDDATVVVQPDHVAEIDRFGCLEITRGDTQ
jgi:N-methylhydantoinase A